MEHRAIAAPHLVERQRRQMEIFAALNEGFVRAVGVAAETGIRQAIPTPALVVLREEPHTLITHTHGRIYALRMRDHPATFDARLFNLGGVARWFFSHDYSDPVSLFPSFLSSSFSKFNFTFLVGGSYFFSGSSLIIYM